MCSAVTLPLRIEAGGQLALRDRVVAAVRHVFFARPDELDRRARHLLGDRDRLAHPIVYGAAAAEAAAQQQLVDLAFRERQFGGLRRRGQRRLAVLRRRPDFAALGVQRAVAFITSIVAWFWCG